MNRLRTFLRGRRQDERGATLILVAGSMALLLPVALAFTVEIGEDTVVNRSLQTAADAGAVDGAKYLNVSPDHVSAIAAEAAQRNYSGVTTSVLEGSWSSATGFTSSVTCEATSTCTAVKVTTSGSVKHVFEAGSNSLTRSAVAVLVSGNAPGCTAPCTPIPGEAGFSIGSYLISISTSQSAVLNTLFGSLGTSATLTAVGYQGLANTYVTVQNLIDASGGVLTPSNVLTTSLSPAQWDSFFLGAVTTQAAGLASCGAPVPYPCTAKASLTTLGGSMTGSFSTSLCHLVSINGSSCSSGGLTESGLQASLNVFQILDTYATLANGTNGLDVKTALNLLGITSATLTLSLIQPPQIAYGPVGTTATTSQVNVDLKLSVLGLGVLDLPITGADGTATLANISCTNNAMTSTTINALTTAVNANITLLAATVGSITVTAVPSTGLIYTPPTNPVPPTTTSINNGKNPQNIGSTSPGIGLSLVGIPLFAGLLSNLGTTLAPLLQTLGVNVGGAQVADLSTNCDPVTLVG
jgi:uncharacterized membrane protein